MDSSRHSSEQDADMTSLAILPKLSAGARGTSVAEAGEAVRWRRTAYRLATDLERDPATMLPDRAHFEETLVKRFKRAGRRAELLSFLFARLSDRQPASAKMVADAFAARLGHDGLIASYQPGELVGMTFGLMPNEFQQLAHEVYQESAASPSEGPGTIVTLAGLTCLPLRRGLSFEAFLAQVDHVMRQARQAPSQQLTLLSLIQPDEESLIQSVRQLHFLSFLREQEGWEVPADFEPAERSPSPLIGRLARQLGMISPRRLRRILFEERKRHELFGEVALRLGYLEPRQLHVLLALQRENPVDWLASLADQGLIPTHRCEPLLRKYYQFLGCRCPASSSRRLRSVFS